MAASVEALERIATTPRRHDATEEEQRPKLARSSALSLMASWRRGVVAFSPLLLACNKTPAPTRDAAPPADDGSIVTAPSATAIGNPRPGMLFIPSGVLKAGTPVNQVPRVAGEELPWTDVPLAGFYIDELPWPNEQGAIPMANVSRDEAEKLCEGKEKRLCTELEWERACKGPNNTFYEYGDDYRASVCGTGVTTEEGAKRPSGLAIACGSAFGARDMHGGVWEWTDSPWGRGNPHELGVIRGGNATQGELVGRCANARAIPPATKSPTVGFRCCAGPRNEARVDLKVTFGQALHPAKTIGEIPQAMALGCGSPIPDAGMGSCVAQHAWVWRPIPNVELYIKGGCTMVGPRARCGVVVGRAQGGKVEPLVSVDAGYEAPEVVLLGGEERSVRMRGRDNVGPIYRVITYAYGRIEVHPVTPK